MPIIYGMFVFMVINSGSYSKKKKKITIIGIDNISYLHTSYITNNIRNCNKNVIIMH